MTLDKAVEHGKEKRKPYRGSKAVARSCENHGGCPWCEGNRAHADNVRRDAADQQVEEYEMEDEYDFGKATRVHFEGVETLAGFDKVVTANRSLEIAQQALDTLQDDLVAVAVDRVKLIEAVQMAYKEHAIDYKEKRWDSLCETLHETLHDVLGKEACDKWIERAEES